MDPCAANILEDAHESSGAVNNRCPDGDNVAGLVFAVLLFFSQKGVSLYKHCVFMPDNTCPWNAGSGVDPLGF